MADLQTYTYLPFIAIDPSTGKLAVNTVGNLYDQTTDPTFTTPIAVVDLGGNEITDIPTNSLGVVQSFTSDTADLFWKQGTSTPLPVSSMQQYRDAAQAAQAAAEAAQAAAEAAGANQIAPTVTVVQSVVNSQDLTPTGSWDWTGATVTGLVTSGSENPNMTITDEGTFYEFDVLDDGNVSVTDNSTYWTFSI